MDCEEPKNKAKLMKKRNVQSVHKHFEEVLTLLSDSPSIRAMFF